MKKNTILFVAAIVLVIVLIVASFFVGTKTGGETSSSDPNAILENAQKESKAVKETEMKEHTKIDVAKYLEYYAGSEQKLILVGRKGCPYCQIADPILKNLAYQYNIEINYLDTDEFTDETQTQFIKSDEQFSEGFGTPLLMIVKDNQIVDLIDGLVDTEHYVEFLTAYGFIQ